MHSGLELPKMGYRHLQAKELILAILHVHHVSRTLNTVPAGNGVQLQSGVKIMQPDTPARAWGASILRQQASQGDKCWQGVEWGGQASKA